MAARLHGRTSASARGVSRAVGGWCGRVVVGDLVEVAGAGRALAPRRWRTTGVTTKPLVGLVADGEMGRRRRAGPAGQRRTRLKRLRNQTPPPPAGAEMRTVLTPTGSWTGAGSMMSCQAPPVFTGRVRL